MTTSRLQRTISTAAVLGLIGVSAAGCGAPDPSYSSLDDSAMMKLFPTTTEVKTALGDDATPNNPRPQIPNANPTQPPKETLGGMSQECYDAVFGRPSSGPPTRIFSMDAGSSAGKSFKWVISQRSSGDELRKNLSAYEDRARKCSSIEFFDAGTKSGMNYATKKTADMGYVNESATGVVTSGDVSMAFTASGLPYDQAEDLVRKMTPVMEKRLKESAPKS